MVRKLSNSAHRALDTSLKPKVKNTKAIQHKNTMTKL